MKFSQLQLNPQLLSNLAALGYQQASEIQQQAIPLALAGHDLMACAQTGTGKTAAFCLPILQIISQQQGAKHIQALIVTPTRELAQQVHQSLESYAKGSGLNCALVYGGVSIDKQQLALKQPCHIVVATPGRILDHLKRGSCDLKHLQYLVLDEADRMLDLGFKDELSALLKRLPKQRQTMLFSATLDASIYRFAKPWLNQAKQLEVAKAHSKAVKIEERVYNVDQDKKAALLCQIIKQAQWQQALVFCRTKQGVDKLVKQLIHQGINASALHGDLSQSAREHGLAKFKAGDIRLLVATDVAARGIDVSKLACVINLELPYKSEDYTHRIGRTGRAGESGIAITLLSVDDEHLLHDLEAQLNRRLPQQWYPGFEPDLSQPAPSNKRNTRSVQKRKARQRALGNNKRHK